MQTPHRKIPRQLTFDPSNPVYEFVDDLVVARQTVLMEFQRQLTTLVTAFINSKFRRRVRYQWDYLQALSDLLPENTSSARFVRSTECKAVANNIVAAYEILQNALPRNMDVDATRQVTVPRRFVSNGQRNEPCKTLDRIRSQFTRLHDADCAYGAYAHGSMGSRDSNGYSDIDLLLILTEKAVRDPTMLLKCRDTVGAVCRDVYCYDVLQHHGVFLISEIDLGFYPEAYLPIPVLQNAAVFCGEQRLELKLRDSHFDAIRSYQMTASFLWSWEQAPRRMNNLDRVKGFVSNLLLLPCLYLETRGIFCYKRESFALVEPFLSDFARTSIEVASSVRDEWTRKRINFEVERALIRTGIASQYLVRAGFACTLDRLYVRRYLVRFDKSFWNSLRTLLQEFDDSYGVPVAND